MADTIREFIVSLGWANDEAAERKFNESLERATTKAFEFGAALEGIALVAATALNETAANFQKLAYQAEQLRTSATDIRAFQFAVKELGGSAEQASAALQVVADKLNANPSNAPLFERLGFQIDHATGKITGFNAAMEKAGLGQYPRATQQLMLSQAGIEDRGIQNLIINHGEELQGYWEQFNRDAASQGLDFNKMSEDGKKFEQLVTAIFTHLDNTTDKWSSKIEEGLLGPLKSVDNFITAHPDLSALLLGGGVAVAGRVAVKGGGSLLKNMLGGGALDSSAAALTGSATALDEAALALKGAAIPKGALVAKAATAAETAAAPAGAGFGLSRILGLGGILTGISAGAAYLLGKELLFGAPKPELTPEQYEKAGPAERAIEDARRRLAAEANKPLHDRPVMPSPAPSVPSAAPEDHRSWWQKEKDLWWPWGSAKASDVDADQDRVNRSLKSYDDGELGSEQDREARRGRALSGLPTSSPGQGSAGPQEPPARPSDDLRDQRFEALRAMLDIGTSEGGAAIKVDGVPVSAGHPLPVTFGQQDQLQLEGADAFGRSGAGGSGGESAPPDTRNWWERHAPKWLGGKDAPAQNLDDNGAGHGGRAGGSNADMDRHAMQMMDRLVKVHGWTPEAAAIAAGNAQQESGVRSDGPMGDPSTPGGSWGMGQWNRERLAALKEFAGKQGKNWQDFDTQVDFWAKEAGEKIPAWAGQKDLRGAGMISHLYEGYGDDSTGTRVANAERFLRLYGSKGEQPAAPAFSPQVADGAPPAQYHRKNTYTGGESDEYPSPTERSAPQAKEGEQPHDYLLTKPKPYGDHFASAFRPESYPAIHGGDWNSWFADTFSIPHAEAATAPQASHSFEQNVNIKVDGATDPSIVAHQVASRVKRSATDLTVQFRGAVQ